MAITVASRSINLPDKMAEEFDTLFFVETTLYASSFKELLPHLPAHLKFVKELKHQGKVVLGGPFYTGEGDNTGSGVYVLKVDSLQEAQRIAASDPMHIAGLRVYTVRPWLQSAE